MRRATAATEFPLVAAVPDGAVVAPMVTSFTDVESPLCAWTLKPLTAPPSSSATTVIITATDHLTPLTGCRGACGGTAGGGTAGGGHHWPGGGAGSGGGGQLSRCVIPPLSGTPRASLR